MDKKTNTFGELVRLTLLTFACTILAMSAAGWFFGGTEGETSEIFTFGSDGLAFRVIFQVLMFAIVNSSISLSIAKIMGEAILLWHMLVTMLSCLIASCVMVVVFGWLSFDSWAGWIMFIGTFVAVFVLASTAIVIKVKWDDKRYNALLLDYKNNKEIDND